MDIFEDFFKWLFYGTPDNISSGIYCAVFLIRRTVSLRKILKKKFYHGKVVYRENFLVLRVYGESVLRKSMI